MPNLETAPVHKELSVDQIFNDTLSDDDYQRACELDAYVTGWVLGNLPLHGRAIYMHMCAKGRIDGALNVLFKYFADADSEISPSEPQLWIEWANYWQRGFDPHASRQSVSCQSAHDLLS